MDLLENLVDEGGVGLDPPLLLLGLLSLPGSTNAGRTASLLLDNLRARNGSFLRGGDILHFVGSGRLKGILLGGLGLLGSHLSQVVRMIGSLKRKINLLKCKLRTNDRYDVT